MIIRAPLLAMSSLMVLVACASDPAARPVAIEYRNAEPGTESADQPSAAALRPPSSPSLAPAPTMPAPARPSSSPAVQDAAAMAPETGQRPGGARRLPRDNPAARAIEVQRGDSLYEISRRYSVNLRAMIETNKLEPPYAMEVGQVVYLPPPNIHTVERGETLYSVSRRYNVDTRSLALLNGLARPWTVWPGDELLLPPLARDQSRSLSTSRPALPVVAPAPTAATPSPRPAPSASQGTGVSAANLYAVNPVSGSTQFIWPASGQVLRGFGVAPDGQRNDGVNIGVARGAEVRAAAAGEVVYSGDELSGFGNLLLIRHPGGWVSAYAHSEIVLVKEGDKVGQGAIIARAGQTGSVSRPQVHFELRRGRDPVDPAAHMPALQDRAS